MGILSEELDWVLGFEGSRMVIRGIRRSDPGRSPWWLSVPVAGALVCAVATLVIGFPRDFIWITAPLGAIVGFAVSAMAPVKAWFTTKALEDRVAELAGVGESITKRSLDSLRVHRSDRDVSQFAPRDIFPEVCGLLSRRTPVLAEGQSMSGKTRLMVEALREKYGNATLWFPADDDGITALVESGQDPVSGTVVFLDDLDRFLSNNSMSLTLLEKWISAGCIVAATMTTRRYGQWRDNAASKLSGWDVLNRFTRVHLDSLPTNEELEAIEKTGYADLIASVRELGLPAFLGGAPYAKAKFKEGSESRTWGWALVRAAADWRRVGLGPSSTDQLQVLAAAYPDAPSADPDWNEAWEWATKPFNHTVALIRAIGPGRWEALEIIADDASWSLCHEVLDAIVAAGLEPSQKLVLARWAYVATGLSRAEWIECLLEQARADGDINVRSNASHGLATLFISTNRKAERILPLLDFALENNPANAAILGMYAYWYVQIQEDDLAEIFFKKALAADPVHANNLANYANFLTDVRMLPMEAEEMYERAFRADPEHVNNLGNYARFLEEQGGKEKRVEELYKTAAVAGPTHANNLGNYANFLAVEKKDYKGAKVWHERALEAEPNHATNLGNFARVLFVLGDDPGGEARAVQALELATGSPQAQLLAECNFYLFMHSLTLRRKAGSALKSLLLQHVSTGDWSFADNLFRLKESGDVRYELCEAVAESLKVGNDYALKDFSEWQRIIST